MGDDVLDDGTAGDKASGSTVGEGIPEAFLRAIPKADLHVHLDGSIRLDTMIDLAREVGVELPAYTVEGLKETVFKKAYSSLEDYLTGFRYTTAVMKRASALERIGYEFCIDSFLDGVRYVEVRFAPQLHAGEAPELLSVEDVIRAVFRGMERAKVEINARPEITAGDEPDFHYGIIVCALRAFVPEMSGYYASFLALHRHEAPRRLQSLASMAVVTCAVALRDMEGIPIVGLDIAGPEAGFPASIHEEAYHYAQSAFMHKTVHASEAYGPQSVYQAITLLAADRIGHGLHLFDTDLVVKEGKHSQAEAEKYVDALSNHVADRRILIEVCLTSNLQTHPDISLDVHPLPRFLDKRMSVCICTDNRTFSHCTATSELVLAVGTYNISRKTLKDMVIAGFKRSFFHGPYTAKRAYVRRIFDFYEKLEAAHFP